MFCVVFNGILVFGTLLRDQLHSSVEWFHVIWVERPRSLIKTTANQMGFFSLHCILEVDVSMESLDHFTEFGLKGGKVLNLQIVLPFSELWIIGVLYIYGPMHICSTFGWFGLRIWLNDCLVFHVISAIFQSYYGDTAASVME